MHVEVSGSGNCLTRGGWKASPRRRPRSRIAALLMALTICVTGLTAPVYAWEPSPRECEAYARNEADRRGSVIGGAARGAIGGAIFGAIVGKGKKGAKRGAAVAGVLGAIGRGAERDRVRRDAYDYCMRRRSRW